VQPRELTARSTEVSKILPEFHYDLHNTHMASSICLRVIIFQKPEGTLWTHCITFVFQSFKVRDNFRYLGLEESIILKIS
jgi:hypothetical protein